MKRQLTALGWALLPAALFIQGCPSNNNSPAAPAPVTIVELVTATFTATPAVSPTNTPNGTATPTPGPPVVSNAYFTIDENTALVLSNANMNALVVSPIGGDPLSFFLAGPPDHGTVDFSHAGFNNTLTYTPNSGFYGKDSFSYRVFDQTTQEYSAAQAIVITVAFVPTATPTPTLSFTPTPTGSDTPTPTLTATATPTPTPTATATQSSTGTITPPPDTATMTSTSTASPTVTFTLTITPVPPPALSNGNFSTNENITLYILEPTVFSLVTLDPNDDPLYFSLVTPPADGTLSLNADGSFTYTPNSGFSGTDPFTVEVTDTVTNLVSAAATFTITVSP